MEVEVVVERDGGGQVKVEERVEPLELEVGEWRWGGGGSTCSSLSLTHASPEYPSSHVQTPCGYPTAVPV